MLDRRASLLGSAGGTLVSGAGRGGQPAVEAAVAAGAREGTVTAGGEGDREAEGEAEADDEGEAEAEEEGDEWVCCWLCWLCWAKGGDRWVMARTTAMSS
jgi:hypothetical protein